MKAKNKGRLGDLFDLYTNFSEADSIKIFEGQEELGRHLEKRCLPRNGVEDISDNYFKDKKLKKIYQNVRQLKSSNQLGREYDECIAQSKKKEAEATILNVMTLEQYITNEKNEGRSEEDTNLFLKSLPFVEAKLKENIDETEIKDRALRIAIDFNNHAKVILVGEEKYLYNGSFYAHLNDRDLQSYLFRNYYSEISKGSAVPVLSNAGKLVDFCIQKRYDEFPLNENLIVFKNGTLEIETGKFRDNSPKDVSSSSLDIRYDKKRYDMPNTKRFLETIADGDTELYELMLQVIGYILSNDMKAKSFFYLEGVGDAGKSRFCDLIASFFPNSGANKVGRVALQDLDGKFALGNLVNSKLNISEDLPDRPLSPVTVSRIKMLSDSNRLEAEAKYVQKFSFRPTCKFLFASNHPLRLKEYDQAFVNRVVYIPFLKAVPKEKQDRNILRKMQGELPALFNHAFEAYKHLVKSGYAWAGTEKFKPRIEIVGTGITLNKVGELKEFVDTCCSYQSDCTTSVADLQVAYNLFCQRRNFLPIQGARFSRELRQVFPENVIPTKIGNSCRGYKGIQVLKAHLPTEFEEFD